MLVCIDEEAEATAFDVQLVIYNREVVADCRLGDDGAQAFCYLFVLKPLADERDDLALALRERGYFRRVRV